MKRTGVCGMRGYGPSDDLYRKYIVLRNLGRGGGVSDAPIPGLEFTADINKWIMSYHIMNVICTFAP